MGYYKCPRCGSTDAFEGTELVGGQSSGRTVGISNDQGGYIQRHEGGELQHKQVSVIKCRDCGEILGDKDYFLTAEEQQEEQVRQQARQEQIERDSGHWKTVGAVFVFFFLVILFVVLFYG